MQNGIKTLREETKTMVEEILGIRMSMKNLTTEDFYQFLKALQYSEASLLELKKQIEISGSDLIFSMLIFRIIFHSISFVIFFSFFL